MSRPTIDNRITALEAAVRALKDTVDDVLYEHELRLENPSDFTLAHFTRLDTFIDILAGYRRIRKNRPPALFVWLSDISCFNDPLEGRALYQHLDERKLEKFTQRELDFLQEFRKHMIGNRPSLSIGRDPLDLAGGGLQRIFVASFANNDDSLDLWRAYGDNGRGACISMNLTEALKQLQPYARGFSLYGVKYSSASMTRTWGRLLPAIMMIIQALHQFNDEEREKAWGKVRERAFNAMRVLHHLYKHEQYGSERELRLIHLEDLAKSDEYVALPKDESAHDTTFEPGKIRVAVDQRRVYCQSPPIFLGNKLGKVILGPAVEDKERLQVTLKALTVQLWRNPRASIQLSQVAYSPSRSVGQTEPLLGSTGRGR